MKNGFTLVELSIVLVIIGLLIGGILVGQSLISTVKVRNIISEYQRHVMATENFIEKFKCIPGDCNKHFTQTGSGDGTLGETAHWAHTVREIEIFWLQLYQGGLLETPYIGNSGQSGANRLIAGENAPIIEAADDVSNEALLVVFGNRAVGHISDPNWIAYEIGVEDSTNLGGARDRAFFPETALAIDTKIDDGLPVNGGKVTVDGGFNGCQSGGLYDMDAENNCALLFYHQIGKYDFLN